MATPVVAPPLATGESVLVDKWFHQTSVPTRRRKTVAAIAPFIAFVNFAATEPLDALTLDKWFVRQPDPTRRIDRVAEFQSFAIDPEVTQVDKWIGFEEVPHRRLRPVIPDQARDPLQDLSTSEVVTLDKWYGQRPDPTRRAGRVAWVQPFDIDARHLGDAETITLDKWFVRGPDPTYRKGRAAWFQPDTIDAQQLATPQPISMDRWFVRQPDPTYRQKRVAWSQEFTVDPARLLDAELVTLDKWFVRGIDPTRRQARVFDFLSFSTDLTTQEVITLDKWIGSEETPVLRLRPRLSDQIRDPLRDPEILTLDKWWVQANEPKRLPKKIEARYIPSWERTEIAIVPVTWTTYGGPFLYTAANWSASTQFFFEAFFRSSSGTARARLVNQVGAAVSGSEVSTTSSTAVRLRSGALTLTNGDEYFAQFGTDSGSSGAFVLARVIGI